MDSNIYLDSENKLFRWKSIEEVVPSSIKKDDEAIFLMQNNIKNETVDFDYVQLDFKTEESFTDCKDPLSTNTFQYCVKNEMTAAPKIEYKSEDYFREDSQQFLMDNNSIEVYQKYSTDKKSKNKLKECLKIEEPKDLEDFKDIEEFENYKYSQEALHLKGENEYKNTEEGESLSASKHNSKSKKW